MLPRLGQPPLPGQEHPQIVVRMPMVRSEPQGRGIMRDGFLKVALVGQGHPQVMMGFRQGGLQPRSASV